MRNVNRLEKSTGVVNLMIRTIRDQTYDKGYARLLLMIAYNQVK